jgi:DNA modification methylase
MHSGYSKDESNIGNLPYGEIDIIITSPPYSEGIGHSQGRRVGKDKIGKDRFYDFYEHNDINNIGNLKHGKLKQFLLPLLIRRKSCLKRRPIFQKCKKFIKSATKY